MEQDGGGGHAHSAIQNVPVAWDTVVELWVIESTGRDKRGEPQLINPGQECSLGGQKLWLRHLAITLTQSAYLSKQSSLVVPSRDSHFSVLKVLQPGSCRQPQAQPLVHQASQLLGAPQPGGCF